MSQEEINTLISEVRNRINNVDDEKYKVSLMYSYLLAVEKGEVVEKKRPIGDDVKRIEINFLNTTIDAAIFRVKKNKLSGYRYSILPFDNDFDDWVKTVYNYMNKFGSEAPFEFHENLDTSGTYFMDKASETFKGLSFDFQSYSRTEIGKIDSREKDFTSTCLKKLRVHDLIFNYYFNPLDLALFCAEDAQSKFFAEKTKEIRKLDLSNFSEEELIFRAIPYITKFLKKNENEIEISHPINQLLCYFGIYCYDKISQGVMKDSIIEPIAKQLDISKTRLVEILRHIAHFDPSPVEKRPFVPILSNSKIIQTMFEWYWSDREVARNEYDNFNNLVESKIDLGNTLDLEKMRQYNQTLMIEEGAIKYSTIKMRERSQRLVYEARKYFTEIDDKKQLRCFACGFVKPSSIKNEIVHIHHNNQLKEIDSNGVQIVLSKLLENVIPLCPTCHSIAHSQNTPLSLVEIKKLIKSVD